MQVITKIRKPWKNFLLHTVVWHPCEPTLPSFLGVITVNNPYIGGSSHLHFSMGILGSKGCYYLRVTLWKRKTTQAMWWTSTLGFTTCMPRSWSMYAGLWPACRYCGCGKKHLNGGYHLLCYTFQLPTCGIGRLFCCIVLAYPNCLFVMWLYLVSSFKSFLNGGE